MSETQSISQQASVAPTEGVLRRSIQMKQFLSDRKRALFQAAINMARANGDNPPDPIALGQVVGEIAKVEPRMGRLPDGTEKESLFALGDFEAVNYETGEVFQSNGAYLPGYYLAGVKALLDAGSPRVELAIEIGLEATGKEIPTAYVIRPLVTRAADTAVNRMKARLAQSGRLHPRLPPPVALEQPRLPAPLEPEVEDPADHEPDPDTMQGAGSNAAENARRSKART